MNDLKLAERAIVLDDSDDEVEGMSRPPRRHLVRTLARRVDARMDEAGMATAEYAVGMVTATGLAGVLLTLLKGDVVRGLLTTIVRRALSV